MCGRFSLATFDERMAEVYRAHMDRALLDTVRVAPGDERSVLSPRFNIAPGQRVLMVRRVGDERRVEAARWGWPLRGGKGGSGGGGGELINARAETAGEKPTFKESVRTRRCLIPADGFYEWRRDPGGKIPMWIRPSEPEPFALGGLWRPGTPDEVVVLTMPPSQFMADIHDRMPVMLRRDDWNGFLDPKLEAISEETLRPPAGDWLCAHEVSTRVNAPASDDRALIEPARSSGPRSLFD